MADTADHGIPTYDQLDELVDVDPIALRDVADSLARRLREAIAAGEQAATTVTWLVDPPEPGTHRPHDTYDVVGADDMLPVTHELANLPFPVASAVAAQHNAVVRDLSLLQVLYGKPGERPGSRG